MATKLKFEFSDMARRLSKASDALAVELMRRGILPELEIRTLIEAMPMPKRERMRQMQRVSESLFASELANADRQLAARAVLRGLLSREELASLDAMLRFQPRGKRASKLDELIRIVERALGGEDAAIGGHDGNSR